VTHYGFRVGRFPLARSTIDAANRARIASPEEKEAMAEVGRNDRCSCGSGHRLRRCCGVSARPGPEGLARTELSDLTCLVAPALTRHSEGELQALLARVPELPRTHPSLAWTLPRVLPAELEALQAAAHADDLDAVRHALPDAVAAVDTQVGRAHLARAVLALRDAGHLEASVAAAAVADLASGSPQLVTASLVEAVVAEARIPVGERSSELALARP
jgi:hypothetical protein